MLVDCMPEGRMFCFKSVVELEMQIFIKAYFVTYKCCLRTLTELCDSVLLILKIYQDNLSVLQVDGSYMLQDMLTLQQKNGIHSR